MAGNRTNTTLGTKQLIPLILVVVILVFGSLMLYKMHTAPKPAPTTIELAPVKRQAPPAPVTAKGWLIQNLKLLSRPGILNNPRNLMRMLRTSLIMSKGTDITPPSAEECRQSPTTPYSSRTDVYRPSKGFWSNYLRYTITQRSICADPQTIQAQYIIEIDGISRYACITQEDLLKNFRVGPPSLATDMGGMSYSTTPEKPGEAVIGFSYKPNTTCPVRIWLAQ